MGSYEELGGVAGRYTSRYKTATGLPMLRRDMFKTALKPGEAALFLSNLAYMLDAGLDILYALRLVAGQSKNNELRKTLAEIRTNIEQGRSLSEELGSYKLFPEIVAGAAEAGERTGRLPEIFFRLSGLYETEARVSDEIKKSLVYPVIVSAAMLIVIVISIVFVLPGYARIFEYAGGDLPAPTRLLLGVSAFLSAYYPQVILFMCCLIFSICIFLQSIPGRYFTGLCKLKLPGASPVYLKAVNMRFAYILGILSGAGVDMPSAVRLIQRTLSNPALDATLERAVVDIYNGASLSGALSADAAFDPLLVGMVKVGEETGRLPDVASKCSIFLQRDLDRMTGSLSKLIEPLVTVGLGLILAFVMLAVMLPSFTLTNLL